VREPGHASPLLPPAVAPQTTSANRTGNLARAWSVFRMGVVGGLVILVVPASWVVAPSTVGPGLAVAAVGLGLALVWCGLNNAVLAVMLLLVTMFLREPLKNLGLPAEPRMLAFLGVVGAAAIAVTRGARRAPKIGPVEVAMALYLVWNIGSAITPHTYPTGDPATGIVDSTFHFILIATVIPFTLYLVGRSVFDRESVVRTLLWAVIAFAGYSTFVSIAQFHAPGLVWPSVELPANSGWANRAIGVFGQPVINGLVIVIGFAIALAVAHQPQTPRWQRLLLSLFTLTSLYAIYLTHTRVVWLAFATTLVLGAVLIPRCRTSFIGLILAVGFVVGLSWGTFTSNDRSAGGVGSPDEVSDRLNGITTSLWAVQKQPVAGWGIDRFTSVNTYHHQQWSTEVEWRHGYGESSHLNEFGIAAELGLVGLALWLTVLFLVGRRLIQTVSRLPRDGLCGRDLAVVALIAFVSLIITGLTVDLRFFDFANALVMLLVGTAVGYADRKVVAHSSGSTTEHASIGRSDTGNVEGS
jgi:O-antigen ligase